MTVVEMGGKCDVDAWDGGAWVESCWGSRVIAFPYFQDSATTRNRIT